MRPTRAQELAVLHAVTYAALFDYPLTLAQLRANLGVRADDESIADWWRQSDLLQSTVEHRDGLYFPIGRGDLAATRARREAVSRALLDRDRRILSLVGGMPFVRMAALSGSLAHLNAESSADLDLFVITSPHRVWSVTVSLLLIARLFGWRRRLCLNYVISERALTVEPQDLFSANQIVHLRPLSGHDVFDRFVNANQFAREYYPNATLAMRQRDERSPRRRVLEIVLSLGIAPLFEQAARVAYRWHLRRRSHTWQSRDQVRLDDECLKLHTTSHRADTLERFDAAVAAALRCEARAATIAS